MEDICEAGRWRLDYLSIATPGVLLFDGALNDAGILLGEDLVVVGGDDAVDEPVPLIDGGVVGILEVEVEDRPHPPDRGAGFKTFVPGIPLGASPCRNISCPRRSSW